jgi:hypothetical protein
MGGSAIGAGWYGYAGAPTPKFTEAPGKPTDTPALKATLDAKTDEAGAKRTRARPIMYRFIFLSSHPSYFLFIMPIVTRWTIQSQVRGCECRYENGWEAAWFTNLFCIHAAFCNRKSRTFHISH